jgi:hypothetical protein
MNAGGPTNPGVAITYITGGELVITSAGSGCSSGSPCFPIGDYDLDASVGLGDGGNFEDESGDIGDLYFLPTPSVPVPSFTDDELYINEINSSVYLTLQNGQLNNNDRLSVTVPPVAEYATEPADTPEPPPLALLAAGLLALAGAFYFHTRRTKDGIATAA